ncbi:methylated-DNA-protein-cysteine methyltransferase [Acrasis kona]|uniref:Methylated-DNA--protein-cysteine methyltransferase n=1 Tax=Acrasis kona TaxID=1008807 RepID=A0AAW2YHH5_9EUKA
MPKETSRQDFINPKTNTKITPLQWEIYEAVRKVPEGKISTYKEVSTYLKTSPRAVGQAMKKNPFGPHPVPCHRIIASNYYIGGFNGKWGNNDKVAYLRREGLNINEDGFVQDEDVLFKDFNLQDGSNIKDLVEEQRQKLSTAS